jgi:PAS domain S-box-containing protein/putative nucleotidyltransferase with HDIG domain
MVLGEPITLEGVHRRKDGTTFPVEVRLGVFESGASRLLLGLVRDITARKQAEEALRESKKELQTLMDASPIGISWADMQGNIQYTNRKFRELFGYAVEDMPSIAAWRARAYPDPVYRAQIPPLIGLLSEAQKQGREMTPIEAVITCKDGSTRHVLQMGAFAANHVLATYNDITERKQAEEALRTSEQQFRTLFEESLDGICLADAGTGIIIDCNKALANMVCRERAELIGKPQTILHPPQDGKETFSPTFKQHLTTKEGQILETQVITRTGDIREVEIKANSLNLQGRKLLQGVFRDITERKQVKELLLHERETFSTILENAIYGVVLMDKDGKYLYVNPAFTAITGYTLEDIPTGRDWMHKAYPDKEYRQKVREFWKKDFELGGVNRELRVVCKDGGIKEIEFRPTWLPDGRAIVMLADITKRKQAEQALQGSYHKLQETLITTVNSLASIVEMRDPYTAGHQRRVTILACAIAKEMGLTGEQFDGLRFAGLIHDIGKNSVPMEILNKPGRISEMESNIIKIHPQSGYNLLKEIEFSWPVAQIVLQHHERLDGSGYPQGLKNGEIMLEAKILAVADVVEAMVSHRPYRPALGIEAALEEITKNREIFYDPEVVDVCTRLFREKGFKFD